MALITLTYALYETLAGYQITDNYKIKYLLYMDDLILVAKDETEITI